MFMSVGVDPPAPDCEEELVEDCFRSEAALLRVLRRRPPGRMFPYPG